MKRLFKTLATVLTFSLAFAASANAQGLNIRKMNFNKVLAEYWKTKELQEANVKERADIEKVNEERQKKLQDLAKEVATLRQQLQDPKVPRPQREKIGAQYQRKAERLRGDQDLHKAFMQGLVSGLEQRNRVEQAQHIKEIRETVKKYMEENKLDGVIDDVSMVVMKESYDVTDEILEKLNKGQGKKDGDKKDPKPEPEDKKEDGNAAG